MFRQGDDVYVDFDGVEHYGHVEKIERGWIVATVQLDPLEDYGTASARLAPYQTVCVPASRVRIREVLS